MSVLIKGVEMPKHDDEYVIFTVYGDGGVVYGPLNRPHVRYKNRAVPVPEHGRLIDADALMEEFRLPKDLLDPAQVLMHITGVRVAIQTAPTIIPAEEASECLNASTI